MDCKQLEKEIFLNGLDDKAVTEHLAGCAECRAIAASLECFVAAKPNVEKYKIPKRIDEYITSEAVAFIDKRKNPQTYHAEMYVKPFYRWASVFAYAACFILVAWMALLALTDSNRTPIQANEAESALSSQNINKWDNLDMDDDLFALNKEIDINFASLSFSDEKGEDESENQDEFYIEVPDFII